MNYNLNKNPVQQQKNATYVALKSLMKLITHERKNLLLAAVTMMVNSGLNLLGPFLVGYTIDKYPVNK